MRDIADTRIAVTGHRWNRIDRLSAQALRSQLQKVFLQLDREFRGAKTLVSGMAEGTDLTAASVRPANWRLEAVLPLPAPDWQAHLEAQSGIDDAKLCMRLLSDATTIVLHNPNGPDFGALSVYLVNTCAVLVAVWNQKPGLPGGTADVVRQARDKGLRVIFVPPPGPLRHAWKAPLTASPETLPHLLRTRRRTNHE